MITQDIFRRTESNPKDSTSLKTPDVFLEGGDFVELSHQEGTSSPLFMSFDLEDATLHNSSSHAKLCHVESYEDNTDSTLDQINSFVKMLASKSNTVKYEAASALLHVLSINHVDAVVECGALPALIQALSGQKEKVRDECVKCLDIIVKYSKRYKELVLRNGGLLSLLRCADEATGDTSRANALRAASSVLSHDYQLSVEHIKCCVPQMIKMLRRDSDPMIIVECSQMLCTLVHGCPVISQLILDHGAKKHLQDLLSHEDESVVVSSIRLTRHLIAPRTQIEQSSCSLKYDPCAYPSSSRPHEVNTSGKVHHRYSCWTSKCHGTPFTHPGPSSVVTPSMGPTVTKLSPVRMDRFLPPPASDRDIWYSRNYDKKVANITPTPSSLWRQDSSPSKIFPEYYAKECTVVGSSTVDYSQKVNEHKTGHHDIAHSPKIPKVCRLSHNFHYQRFSYTPEFYRSEASAQLHTRDNHAMPSSDPTSEVAIAERSDEDKQIQVFSTKHKATKEIISEKEKYLLSDYSVLVLEQLRPCRIENKECLPDSRYPFPLGFPGLECVHCAGTKEARRFFWSTAVRFKNNNGEFAKHLHKCTHCPETIKEQLNFMKTYHTRQMKSLPRGNMSLVFKRIFRRLQGKEEL